MEEGAIIKHDLTKGPKTGTWRYMKPEVNKTRCAGCGTCVGYCPEATITVERVTQNVERMNDKGSTLRDTSYATIDYEYCKGCGVCATVCPLKAILMKKN